MSDAELTPGAVPSGKAISFTDRIAGAVERVKGVAGDFYYATKQLAVGEILRNIQNQQIFNAPTNCEFLRKPQEYAGLDSFKEEKISRPFNGSSLALWHKAATDRTDHTKPVFVVFHGRYGHWGDVGITAKHQDQTCDRHYRITWLKALAATGAEVIAVHLSGQGASRKFEPRGGENQFRHDAQAVADYLQQQGIAPEHVVIAGESLGGAAAAILAEEMTKRKQPPAALGLISTFSNMAEIIADMREIALPWVKNPVPIPPMPIARVHKALRTPLNTADRIGSLDTSTLLYLAHNPDDSSVAFKHMGANEKPAHNRGLTVMPRVLTKEYMRPGLEYPHISWDPVKVTADLLTLYEKSQSIRQHLGVAR